MVRFWKYYDSFIKETPEALSYNFEAKMAAYTEWLVNRYDQLRFEAEKKCTIPEAHWNKILDWLCEEYPYEEAEYMLSKARIFPDGNRYVIVYNNSVADVVEVNGDEVKHIL